jgi:hypothetical protein
VGRRIGVGEAYRQTLGRFGALFLVDVVLALGFVALFVTCVGILALPYIIPALEFTSQTVLLEHRDPIAAIRRSWQLAEGHRWRIIRCQIAGVAICWLFISAPVYVLHWWAGVSHDNPLLAEVGLAGVDEVTRAVWVVDQVINIVGATVLWPLYYTLSTVLYLDLRAREAPYRLPTRSTHAPQLPG